MFFIETIKRISFIAKLVVATPNYGRIVAIQFVSGIFSIAGIPLLIPVLEYIRTDIPREASQGNLGFIDKAFGYIGVTPSFYVVLAVASALILSGQVLVFISVVIAQNAQLKLSEGYRKKLFSSYLRAEWLWLLGDRSGEMNHAVIREADLAGVAHLNAQRIVIYLIQIVVFMFVAIKLSFSVTILACIVYGIIFLVNLYNTNSVHRLSENFNEVFKKLSSSTANLLQNKKFFKSSLVHEGFMRRVFQYIDESVRTMKIINLREQAQISWTFLITFIFLISLLMFYKTLNIGFSELLVVLLVFQRLSPQFTSLFSSYLSLNKDIPVYQSIVNRLTEIENHKEFSGGSVFQFDKAIHFKDVNFSYPTGESVLNNICLEIKPFQNIGFVGSSGAGKTTLLDLILGLLKPGSGTIYYADIPHDQLNIDSFRNNIAYVSQETTLLDGTLLENLTIGCPEATEQMIKDVCEKVHIDDLVRELPEGLLTEIGENGINLSGGQRQRVALGRALFMSPKILILDEATSDLDTETEMLIQEAIQGLRQSMSIIIVAHRLSTVKSADMIYVIEDGSICEAGTYSELIEKKGRFYYLDSLQPGIK
ncbi:MAG: ABC transporter ATP-binding protein [Candidatus Scalindua sp.]|jgi:ATP-binding cassette, subfamily C, bacterial|nr:ABC transporter ATP-binding protein [Candidatus Scalindua sp.]MBT6230415.1 ABC transporter ATP-binding protein [Candidatus Scalindua sp.]